MATLVKYMDVVLDFVAAGQQQAMEHVDKLGCQKSVSVGGAYGGFFLAALIVAVRFSDWDFSTVLTASAGMQCLAFILLTIEVKTTRSARGLSARMMELYVVVLTLRLLCTLFKNGYLPVDRSGDYIYQLGDVASLVVAAKLYWKMTTEHYATYQAEFDTMDTRWMALFCVVLGICIHGHLNRSFFFDSAWTVSLHLDTIAILPQLWMMRKQGGQVEGFTAHFVACMFVSKFLSWLFWYRGYSELAEGYGEGKGESINWAGYSILLSQSLQVLVCVDYMYYYVLSIVQKRPVQLPDLDL